RCPTSRSSRAAPSGMRTPSASSMSRRPRCACARASAALSGRVRIVAPSCCSTAEPSCASTARSCSRRCPMPGYAACRGRRSRSPWRSSASGAASIRAVDARARERMAEWLGDLSDERRASLYLLLDELCSGLDVSRHNRFGFLRLRAEFETSGELFGCTLEELREALARSLGDRLPKIDRPQSALEELRDRIATRGHPDFR